MDKHRHLGLSLAFIIVGDIFRHGNRLARIGNNRQKNVLGCKISGVEGSGNYRNLFFIKILSQSQRAAGRIVQVKHNAFVQKLFEIAFGHFRFVTIVSDVGDQFVIP